MFSKAAAESSAEAASPSTEAATESSAAAAPDIPAVGAGEPVESAGGAVDEPVEALEASPEVRETAIRIGVLARRLFAYGDGGRSLQVADEHGLSFIQLKAMIELSTVESASAPCIQDVAEELGVSMPALSRAFDGLVQKDLISRSEDPDDRRRKRIGLTAAGKEIVNEFIYSRTEGALRFSASLDPAERKALDQAVGMLLEREDIAPIYRHLEKVGPQ